MSEHNYYIAYDVKEVQKIVEYVNANDPNLQRPLSLKEVAEKCISVFFDRELTVPTWNGITFTYRSFPEDPHCVYCRLTVPVHYPIDDKTLKIVDVTEDLNKSVELDMKEEEEAINAAVEELAQELGVELNSGGEYDEEDDYYSYTATAVDSKNKKLH